MWKRKSPVSKFMGRGMKSMGKADDFCLSFFLVCIGLYHQFNTLQVISRPQIVCMNTEQLHMRNRLKFESPMFNHSICS